MRTSPQLVPVNKQVFELRFISLGKVVLELFGCRGDVVDHALHLQVILSPQSLDILPVAESGVDFLIGQRCKASITRRWVDWQEMEPGNSTCTQRMMRLRVLQQHGSRSALTSWS